MTRRTRAWIVLLAAAGLLASALSTYGHARLLRDPGYAAFCDVSAAVSCTDVYGSRFGSVAGVPVALGGVLWFGGVLLLVLADARGPRDSRADVAGYLVAWSTAGLAVAMYLAYASLVVLQTFCLLCGVVYVAAIGIFVLSDSASATPLRRLPAAVARDVGRLARRPLAWVLAMPAAAGLAAAVVWLAPHTPEPARLAPGPAGASREAEFDRWWASRPRVEPPIAELEASVVVVMFTDYQCPACARAYASYEPIFARYEASRPGAVRLVTMDFPLDPQCNPHAPAGPHDAACEAAAAVRLARRAGSAQAAALQRWLYVNQETLTPERIAAALRDIAGVEDFAAGYDEALAEVAADIAAGAALPVEATPTFVVNGVLVRGGLAPAFFERAIARELARLGNGPRD